MILSGLEIKKEIENGGIYIENFDISKLNPNSYNLTLHNELKVYEGRVLDMRVEQRTKDIIIPEDGYMLEPGELYLARTAELTKTDKFVPMLEGRSSIGRLGMFIHVTAGFGDVGFQGTWTLEITVVKPLVIYPWVEIGQIYYHTIEGEYEKYSSGKYQGQKEIRESMMYKDFQKKNP